MTHKPVVLITVQVLFRTHSIDKPPNIIDNASLHGLIPNAVRLWSHSFNLKRTSTSHLFRLCLRVHHRKTCCSSANDADSFVWYQKCHFVPFSDTMATLFVSLCHTSYQCTTAQVVLFGTSSWNFPFNWFTAYRNFIVKWLKSTTHIRLWYETLFALIWQCYGWNLDLIPSARQYCIYHLSFGERFRPGLFFCYSCWFQRKRKCGIKPIPEHDRTVANGYFCFYSQIQFNRLQCTNAYARTHKHTKKPKAKEALPSIGYDKRTVDFSVSRYGLCVLAIRWCLLPHFISSPFHTVLIYGIPLRSLGASMKKVWNQIKIDQRKARKQNVRRVQVV